MSERGGGKNCLFLCDVIYEWSLTGILKLNLTSFIFALSLYNVIVWTQYDGANIGYGWCQNQEAKLKIVGGVIP